MPTAKMMIQTTEGLHETQTRVVESTDPKVVSDFLGHGGTTAGFSISFAVNPETKTVVKIFKKGRLSQRDLKPLLANGYREFHYSWAFSGKTWHFLDGTSVQVQLLDLTKVEDILPWARAFGY